MKTYIVTRPFRASNNKKYAVGTEVDHDQYRKFSRKHRGKYVIIKDDGQATSPEVNNPPKPHPSLPVQEIAEGSVQTQSKQLQKDVEIEASELPETPKHLQAPDDDENEGNDDDNSLVDTAIGVELGMLAGSLLGSSDGSIQDEPSTIEFGGGCGGGGGAGGDF